ncbi:hypothetical protein ASZ78_001969 [Callipepla squamata]|uniref:Uncharacterized protein n=1 Tax=Callipepla squamata TaxID=9009 RepID=A0A226MUF3_CALSU|nr:hypothetical protein ASZ78_001969 [Callipepla squamata]
MHSPRASDRTQRSTASRLPELVPCPQGSAQTRDDVAERAENQEARTLVPVLPFLPVHATPKSLRLAYRRRPVADKPKPCQKRARPKKAAPTSTLATPRTAKVPAPKAESDPAEKTQPDPSAQKATADDDGAPTSCSQAAQPAADHGAKEDGTPESTPAAKDAVEPPPPRFFRLLAVLSCSLCKAACEQRKGKDPVQRDAAVQLAKVPVRTPSDKAEAQPPASAMAASPQHKVSKVNVVGNGVNGGTVWNVHGEAWQDEPCCSGPAARVC